MRKVRRWVLIQGYTTQVKWVLFVLMGFKSPDEMGRFSYFAVFTWAKEEWKAMYGIGERFSLCPSALDSVLADVQGEAIGCGCHQGISLCYKNRIRGEPVAWTDGTKF